jgi:small ligand-binding sensory domain FIST
MIDSWNSDLMLSVIQFLNVQDSSRFAQTAARYLFLVRQFQKLRGPELVASASRDPLIKTRQKTGTELCLDTISKIQSAPNLAIAFSTLTESLSLKLPKLLPTDTIIIEAVAESIQSSGIHNQVECKSRSGLMLASLPHATIHPFCFEGSSMDVGDGGSLSRFLAELSKEDWKVFIVYVCGNANGAETFVSRVQEKFPEATIVGGVCSQGAISAPFQHVSKEQLSRNLVVNLLDLNQRLGGSTIPEGTTKKELVEHVYNVCQGKKYCITQVEDGIFGIALAGEVPFRSIVSRGVKSLIHQGFPEPSTGTSYYVETADLVHPNDDAYMFRGETPPPYHLIRNIRNEADGKLYTPIEMLMKYGQADMIGVRRAGEDGFVLRTPHSLSYSLNAFLLLCDVPEATEESLVGANIDLYDLDGEACCIDVDRKMQLLKEETRDEKILGAIMFSCNGRGPTAGSLIREEMSDAKRFANIFPGVPCLGFYAYGEIGPMALAGRQSCFQTGNACVQGFTAVFAMFVVPEIDLATFDLNDSAENVQAFLKGYWERK